MNAAVVAKIHRTRNSINAHIARGNGVNSRRGHELVDRYNDLKESLTRVGGYSAPDWKAYCADIGAQVSHDGYDLFA
jgi:hypothetical protein